MFGICGGVPWLLLGFLAVTGAAILVLHIAHMWELWVMLGWEVVGLNVVAGYVVPFWGVLVGLIVCETRWTARREREFVLACGEN